MHAKDLRSAGETEQRLYSLDAWRETPFSNARERAALAWAEAVTDLSNGHVSDEVYEQVRQEFTEVELELLTAASRPSTAGTASTSVFGECPEITSRPSTNT